MKKLALLLFIILAASCQQPNIEIPAVEEVITEPEPTEEPVTIQPEVEPVTISTEEIMPRTIEMQAIPAHAGYLFQNGMLKGIDADSKFSEFTILQPKAVIEGVETNISIDAFFSLEGNLYFSFTDRYLPDGAEVMTEDPHYFSQNDQIVTEIEAADFPVIPVSERTSGVFGAFEFIIYDWDGGTYNKLIRTINGKTVIVTTSGMLDSHLLTSQGMYFSKPDDIGRQSGLWFMGNTYPAPSLVSGYTRIW